MTRRLFLAALMLAVSTVRPAWGQQSAAPSEEAAAAEGFKSVVFDVATGRATPLSAPADDAPQDATGGDDRLLTPGRLSEEELARFETARASFAPDQAPPAEATGRNVATPKGVIDDDNRIVVNRTDVKPASAIAQIVFNVVDSQDGVVRLIAERCTGSLIANDLLLTAGHCVYKTEWHRDFAIYPGRNAGVRPVQPCKAVRLYALDGWLRFSSQKARRAYDVGAIRLDCDAGQALGWLGFETLSNATLAQLTDAQIPEDQRLITVQGYSMRTIDEDDPCNFNTIEGRQYRSDGLVGGQGDRRIFYQNDTCGGTSGAPVWGANQRVIAVHTHDRMMLGSGYWREFNSAAILTTGVVSSLKAWVRDHSGSGGAPAQP